MNDQKLILTYYSLAFYHFALRISSNSLSANIDLPLLIRAGLSVRMVLADPL